MEREDAVKQPFYIDLEEARKVLSNIGIKLTRRQMKRAADKDAKGRRKLPFFIDPIEGRLKIEKGALVEIYMRCSVNAERNSQVNSRQKH